MRYAIGHPDEGHDDYVGGHSVVFKKYTKNDNDEITGYEYYDYRTIKGSHNLLVDNRFFLGANLKDIN